jgi:hypothetical protein
MRTIVFFLEELSAKVFFEGLIKTNFTIDPQKTIIRYSVYEGKQDLEKNLEKRLKNWQMPDTTFVIMRDQDSGDCKVIKDILRTKCVNAGKPESIIRIACHELESFFLGDLPAVGKGLNLANISRYQNQKKYREPDRLETPSKELESLIQDKEKKRKNYLKVEGSRRITPCMDPLNNKSHSFKVLYKTLTEIIKDKDSGKILEVSQC